MNKHLSILGLLLIGLIISTAPTLAEIYTWTDADGNTVFTDQPQEGAKKIKLPPPQTYSPTNIKSASPSSHAKNKTEPTPGYRLLNITQPLNDQAIRANNGQVDVALAIEPALNTKQGHYINISLDGKVVISKSTQNHLALHAVDRGTHTLSATIHDSSGHPLSQSQSTTFHLHRQSVLHKK